MKSVPGYLVALALILTACSGQAMAPTQTAAPMPSATSALPTATPSIPTIDVDGVQVPDPRVTNPELFDLTQSGSPIPKFVNAMKMAGIEVADQQIVDALGDNNKFQLKSDYDKNPFVQVTYETGIYSLAFIYDDRNGWQEGTCRTLADKHGFLMGSYFGAGTTPEQFQLIKELNATEFILRGVFSGMTLTQPKEGEFDLSARASLIEDADARNMTALVHPLIWSSDSPAWIKSKDRDGMISAMNDHVRFIMTKLGNLRLRRLPLVTVVNEAGRPGDFFQRIIGPEYVEMAFQTARATMPSASLVYSAYGAAHIFNSESYRNTKEIVDRLKAGGLIDVLALQMQIDGSRPPDKAAVIEAMKGYGVPILVSEFIVDIRNVNGSQEERFARQAEIYKAMIEAALESKVAIGFVDFQLGDRFSTWESPTYQYASPRADPTPFDDALQPKPALYAQRAVLASLP